MRWADGELARLLGNSDTGASRNACSEAQRGFTFGGVKIGGKSVQTLTLTNTGKTTVTISQASITGTGF